MGHRGILTAVFIALIWGGTARAQSAECRAWDLLGELAVYATALQQPRPVGESHALRNALRIGRDRLHHLGGAPVSGLAPDERRTLRGFIAALESALADPAAQAAVPVAAPVAGLIAAHQCSPGSGEGSLDVAEAAGGALFARPGDTARLIAPPPDFRRLKLAIYIAVALCLGSGVYAISRLIARNDRRARRHVCHMAVHGTVAGEPFVGVLLDISQLGVKLRGPHWLPNGAAAEIYLMGRTLRACVVWSNLHFSGLALDPALSASELSAILAEGRARDALAARAGNPAANAEPGFAKPEAPARPAILT